MILQRIHAAKLAAPWGRACIVFSQELPKAGMLHAIESDAPIRLILDRGDGWIETRSGIIGRVDLVAERGEPFCLQTVRGRAFVCATGEDAANVWINIAELTDPHAV